MAWCASSARNRATSSARVDRAVDRHGTSRPGQVNHGPYCRRQHSEPLARRDRADRDLRHRPPAREGDLRRGGRSRRTSRSRTSPTRRWTSCASRSAKFTVEGDLRREVTMSIKRLMDLGCYRGTRHRKGLAGPRPAHAHQCTHAQGPEEGPHGRVVQGRNEVDRRIDDGTATVTQGSHRRRAYARRSRRTSPKGSRTSTRRSTTRSSRSPTARATRCRGRRRAARASRARASRRRSPRRSRPRRRAAPRRNAA